MPAAPHPEDEQERLAALRALGVLDSPPEPELDALVRAAAAICGTPISLVSLVDADRQWFKANVGLEGVVETPRELAFCAHAVLNEGLLEVEDATHDARFADNALVTGAPDIRFYAGMPLSLSSGARIGTLCVIDRVPRQLDDSKRAALKALAEAAVRIMEGRRIDRLALAAATDELSRLSLVARFTSHAVIITDAEGVATWVNEGFARITGYAPDEIIGKKPGELLQVPETDPTTIAVMRAAMSRREGCRVEILNGHKNGGRYWLDIEIQALLAADGTLRGFMAIQSDITTRKAQESALRLGRDLIDADRRRLETLIEGTGAGTWEWNVQTGELRLNERWAEIVGHHLADLDPIRISTWLEFAHPDDLARSSAALEAHFAGKADVYECEARMRHRDGHWVWVLDRGRVVSWTDDGKPEWMYGTHIDVTRQRDQQDVLRRSEAMLGRAGELATVGGWELDLASGALRWSDQTCRIHGLPAGYQPHLDEAITFYAPEARPLIEAAVAHAMASGEGWDLELPFVRRDGSQIWVRAMGRAEFEDGKAVRLVGAFQDVSAQRAQRLAVEEARERMALAIDTGNVGVWHVDEGTREAHWDQWVFRQYGWTPTGRPVPFEAWARAIHPDDIARVLRELDALRDKSSTTSIEFKVVWPDGSIHHLRSAVRRLPGDAGLSARMIGLNWDVTAQRKAEEALRKERGLLQVTLQSIGDAVITTDAEGRVTWMNPVAERLTGYRAEEAKGLPSASVFHILHEVSRLPAPDPVATCMSEDRIVGLAMETVLVARDGREHGVEDSAAPIRDADGTILGSVLVFHDVTEQRRLSGEMQYRATHDALTGLFNRDELEARLRKAMADGSVTDVCHALMYIDLDQFKVVNDSCGHGAGDLLLKQVARLFADIVRSRDLLVRMGGDEFAVLMEHCTPEQGQRVAQQICDRLEVYRFDHDGQRFRIGASIGLAPIDGRLHTPEAVLQAADSACFAAKEGGRNRVHLWHDSDVGLQARHGETQWAARLERALDEDRFVLFGQRIESLNPDVEGLHLEALLRLRDENGQLLAPGLFLPAAERFHLASRIDRWVLREVVRYLEACAEADLPALVAVNLSGQSVGDRAFHRQVVERLEAAGPVVCRRLCFEITETAAVTNMVDANAFIQRVRQLGVRIALDDFGAGASSFGYLKSLPVDFLKIDGQFIRDLVDDPLDEAAVRSFVEVARVLGLETIAEFVDRPEVLDRVRAMGVDHAQGYLLHRPEPLSLVRMAASREVGRPA